MQAVNDRKDSAESLISPDFILVENNWDRSGCPTGTVKSFLAKGKQLLKKRQIWCSFSHFTKPYKGKGSLCPKTEQKGVKIPWNGDWRDSRVEKKQQNIAFETVCMYA